MTVLEDILKEGITAVFNIVQSDLYGAWNVVVAPINYYFADKNSKSAKITTATIAALAVDTFIWSWLDGRTLHTYLGLYPGTPYEGLVIVLERLTLGILNGAMILKNLKHYQSIETKKTDS